MPPKVAKAKPTKAKHNRKKGGGSGDGKAIDKLIVAVARLHQARFERPCRKLVGSLAGVDSKSSTMRNACAKLKKEGLADTSDPKTLQLTEKGLKTAGTNLKPLTTNTEFHSVLNDLIREKKAWDIFNILISGPHTRAEIAKKINTEVSKSTFRNALAPLNKLELLEDIEVEGKKALQLTEFCFPFGRDHDTN
jgi:Mn-dependent DtxR family transcriptional regulator